MLLSLMRHGIAGPSPQGGDDDARTLTPEGVVLLQQQAAALKRAGFAVDRLFSSPLARARQTAAIIARALGVEAEAEDVLRPGCVLADVAALSRRYPDARHLMLVGHQPYLGGLVQALTGGSVRMRTGMLAVVEASMLRPGRGVLVGLYDPQWLARLAPARTSY